MFDFVALTEWVENLPVISHLLLIAISIVGGNLALTKINSIMENIS